MEKSIRLSEKHGLNPAITKCFYCGKDIGITLLGKIKTKDQYGNIDNDAKAPMYIISDYEPCDECEEKLKGTFRIYGIAPKHKYQHLHEITKEHVISQFAAIPVNEAENFLNHFQDINDDMKKDALTKNGIMLTEDIFKQVIQTSKEKQ